MNTLQQSPTGMKLLQEAQRRGVKINFAANNGDNVLGQYNPNNNSITVESGNLETMVETLAHELVHATTRENGNSMNEEVSAFVIGEQVAREAGVDQNPHHADFWKNHVANSYKGLAQDNGIMGALNALGVAAGEGNGFAGALPGAQYAPVLNPNDAAAAAANADPTNAANNPYGAANQAAQAAAPTNVANDPSQMMQFMMMILQMIMQMFGQMMNQQQNPTQQQNPLTNNNPLTPQTQAQPQQHQKMFVMTGMNLTA
jgi:hypothetical protein